MDRESFIPRYLAITKAAQTLKKELTIFADCSDSDQQQEDDDNNGGDLKREILFLRSSLDYFFANRVFPFAFRCATEDFCNDYMDMSAEEYMQENKVYWNRYKKRVWEICNNHEPLKNPREKYAFDLGNRIWGWNSLDIKGCDDDDQEDDETVFPAEEGKDDADDQEDGQIDGDGDNDDDDDDGEGVLDKYPFLKNALDFVCRDDFDSEKGCKDKKKMQIDELKSFLDKMESILPEGMALLEELES